MNRSLSFVVTVCVGIACLAQARTAKDIITTAGFKGGVIVHVGCDDPALLCELAAGGNCIVQGVDVSADKVDAAREAIADRGLAGRVTARTFNGKALPFVDNMVNLVVVSGDATGVSREEIERVLAPRGVCIADARWTKPVPADIDEWTHFHHNPAGTMVGGDRVVGPPRRIQWMAGPKWLRNHDFMSNMHAMVSSNGRVFYIVDEGLRNHIFLPSKWVLIARDGFNGTVLWRKPLPDWQPSNWPLKSGPGHFPRRLVAVGDTVYVTAGLIQPVSAIDAVTGKTIRTYGETKPTEELIVSDGVLFAVVDPERKPPEYRAAGTSYKEIGRASSGWAWTSESPERRIVAVRTESGEVLWEHPAKVAPLSLTVTDTQVFYNNGSGLVALDRAGGTQQWAADRPAVKRVGTGGSLRVSFADGIVVHAVGTRLTAFDAKEGRQLWAGSLQKTSHHCPEDLFIIDGKIWSPHTGKPQHKGTHFKVMDVKTGEVVKDFVAKNLPGFPMHPRCYPSKATTRYIMTNGMGTEFYEIGDTTVDINNVVRGSCIYGVMPCNGLLYKPPDTCACYYQSKLEYFCALAPGGQEAGGRSQAAGRLEKGPAYAKAAAGKPARGSALGSASWPMYRCDAERRGFCRAAVSPKLEKAWQVELGGKLTQPVVGYGRAYVSAIEQQTLVALDADSGKEEWRFRAGGRIDSAPTLYKGTVLFGCADGCVYCLRAGDGELVWRYRVAPDERQIISYQQLESVWPVHGCVLVRNDAVYALAGRNMFFDGGMRLALLNPVTGERISETVLDEKDPATGKNLQTLISAKYMPIANRDILSSDGERVYMREQNFDMKGKRIGVAPTQGGKGAGDGGRHLFCQTGLLEDLWFHRSYWVYGSDCGEGWGAYAGPRNRTPCGRIMVLDDSRAYAFKSNPLGNMLHPRTTYDLYASDKGGGAAPAPAAPTEKGKGKKKRPRRGGGIMSHWKVADPPLFVNGMVLAGGNLFVAGPPNVADETKMLGFLPGADDDLNRDLQAQNEAWLGKRGGMLWVVSAETGAKLAEYELESYPVFDGMSAAEGKLFMALKDGTVACYGGR